MSESSKLKITDIPEKLKQAGLSLWDIRDVFAMNTPEERRRHVVQKLKESGIAMGDILRGLGLRPRHVPFLLAGTTLSLIGDAKMAGAYAQKQTAKTRQDIVSRIEQVARTENDPKTLATLKQESDEANKEILAGEKKMKEGANIQLEGNALDAVVGIDLLRRRIKRKREEKKASGGQAL